MDSYSKRFKIDCSPVAPEENVAVFGATRFTVITPCLLRVEYQAKGNFCDEPTQSVWFRDFDNPKFDAKEEDGVVTIRTTKANFRYSLKARKMLRIKLIDGRTVTD